MDNIILIAMILGLVVVYAYTNENTPVLTTEAKDKLATASIFKMITGVALYVLAPTVVPVVVRLIFGLFVR